MSRPDDNNHNQDDIAEAAVVHSRRRVSAIWLVPIVAALLGVWLVYQHYASLGPVATVSFETAEGVIAGKTKVLRRSVEVGVVEAVRLTEDHEGVAMDLRIDRDVSSLLVEDTRFWVVRPRVGGAGISGLGTLVSGGYIEIDPGSSSQASRSFVGLEQPPVTPLGVPGLRLKLVADKAGSLGPGAPVVYKGLKVGKIEDRIFDITGDQVFFDAFIEERYAQLVGGTTRFWNTSGVDLELSTDGFRIRTGNLESLISGGVEFDTPDTDQGWVGIDEGKVFTLYDSRRSVETVVLKPRLTYLLLFKDSVRGLSEEAPVEFRGIRVGKVTGISFEYAPRDPERRVPVLIRLDPTAIDDLPEMTRETAAAMIDDRVKQGLRASLKPGNVLTGQLFVNLTLNPDAEPAEVGSVGKYRTIPTVSSGLARIEDKLVLVLDKLQALPVENTLNGATDALAEIQAAAKSLAGAAAEMETLMASDKMQNLPNRIDSVLIELNRTLAGFEPGSPIYGDLTAATQELRSSLRSFKVLADSIERKPNSLIFGRKSGTITPPKAKRP